MKVITAVSLLLLSSSAIARDNGQYANESPETRQWFKDLKSGRGACCSDADGALVQDADWDTKDGHYRVRIEGEWVVVPDNAVIKEPNLYGKVIVWGYRIQGWGGGGYYIRCFLPGAGI